LRGKGKEKKKSEEIRMKGEVRFILKITKNGTSPFFLE
jgi:hypothetical protein